MAGILNFWCCDFDRLSFADSSTIDSITKRDWNHFDEYGMPLLKWVSDSGILVSGLDLDSLSYITIIR